MKYIHTFQVLAKLRVPLPNTILPDLAVEYAKTEVARPTVTTTGASLDGAGIQKTIDLILKAFNETKGYSDVSVVFISYEEVEDE